jgi:hypothetical protein
VYGVPADLDLTFLHGAELAQVCLGLNQVQLHFHPLGDISIEGHWDLVDEKGCLIDQCTWGRDRKPYQLHRLLGRQIVSTKVAAPSSFTLQFDGGLALRVFDDSPQYESFSIQPGDVIV